MWLVFDFGRRRNGLRETGLRSAKTHSVDRKNVSSRVGMGVLPVLAMIRSYHARVQLGIEKRRRRRRMDRHNDPGITSSDVESCWPSSMWNRRGERDAFRGRGAKRKPSAEDSHRSSDTRSDRVGFCNFSVRTIKDLKLRWLRGTCEYATDARYIYLKDVSVVWNKNTRPSTRRNVFVFVANTRLNTNMHLKPPWILFDIS